MMTTIPWIVARKNFMKEPIENKISKPKASKPMKMVTNLKGKPSLKSNKPAPMLGVYKKKM